MRAKLPKKRPSKSKNEAVRPWLVDVPLDQLK